MRVLLDTCVLSELRHPKGNAGVRRAVDAFDSESLFVSVLSICGIAKGIALLTESQHKRALQIWLQTLERHYGVRLLPVDLERAESGANSLPPPKELREPCLPVMALSLPRLGGMVCMS